MKLKINSYRLTLFVVVFVTLNSNAQDKRIKLKGAVKYDSTYLQDINILNKATNFGISSDKNGHFTIYAKKGDSILFSSIVYKNRIIKISETHISSKITTIYLELNYNLLDEVMLDNKIIIDWRNASVTKGTIFNNDKITNSKAPDARKLTDPNANAGGLNPIALFMALTKKARLKRKRLKVEQEEIKQFKFEFFYKIRNSTGDDFFNEWLHIPNDKINLFLDYCEGNGFLELYDKEEIIIKDFLIKQAKKFNSIKN